jgi:hypothetical protein
MPIIDLYSKRQKRLRGQTPDVFVYDQIPEALRVQIVHIWRNAIGRTNFSGSSARKVYQFLHTALCEEYGLFVLADGNYPEERLVNFILGEDRIEAALDVIELSFQAIDRLTRETNYSYHAGTSLSADRAIEELNTRFLEHGIGFQFISGELIRKDSEFLHKEVIVPALALLQDKRYKGAEDEFLKAHEHFRHGRTKECIAECLKTLESTLKTICQIRRWKFNPTDTAKTLLDVCFENELVPAYLQSHYTALKSTLESGVPTVRNKVGGHGQGPEVVQVPPHYAAYMLHVTGSAIRFLTECEKNR